MSSAERHTDTQNIPLLDKPQMVNQSDKKEEIKEDKKTQQHKILEQKSIKIHCECWRQHKNTTHRKSNCN